MAEIRVEKFRVNLHRATVGTIVAVDAHTPGGPFVSVEFRGKDGSCASAYLSPPDAVSLSDRLIRAIRVSEEKGSAVA